MAVSDFIYNGGFGGKSLSDARQRYSDKEIFDFLNSYGGTIGDKVRQEIAAYNAAQEAEGTNTALGMGSFQRAVAGGQAPEEFLDYAKNSGLTIGSGLQAEIDKYAESQKTLKQRAFEKDSLRAALKVFGSQGERQLGANTLAKLAKKHNTSQENIIKQMDIVNKNQGTKLGIGTNAIKSLAENPFSYGMGSGKVASTAQAYINAIKAPTQVRTMGGGMTLAYGSVNPTLGQKFTAAGLAPLQGSKMVVDSKGNYVPRVSNKKATTSVNTYAPPEFNDLTISGTANPVAADNPGPTEQPVEQQDSKYGQGGASSSVDGGATNFRSRRSRWRMANKTSKGSSNFKITGQNKNSSGVNIR